MNKGELIDMVADDVGCTKRDAKIVVECVFDSIAKVMEKGEAVRLVGFGTFGIRERAARTARNPRTGENISVPAMNVPFFKAGKDLKEKVK
ncbi:MAG: HU family DNA-binding protein [Candidatus Caldatribacteriota bacterium]|nr:HU family DNA-binding protein [Candidatus Caldatribacteriota bacterium]